MLNNLQQKIEQKTKKYVEMNDDGRGTYLRNTLN